MKIFTELKDGLSTLSMDRHGHFIVLALLKIGEKDKEVWKGVFNQLLTKTVKLALHNSSAQVIDYMYAAGKPQEKLRMISVLTSCAQYQRSRSLPTNSYRS